MHYVQYLSFCVCVCVCTCRLQMAGAGVACTAELTCLIVIKSVRKDKIDDSQQD